MRSLTLGDLRLALRELLGEKLPELKKSATGAMYEPRLRAKQAAIDAIPEAALTTAPFAQELADADVDHDGFGGATYFVSRAILVHPKMPASLKATAQEVIDTFVPALDVLRKPYADEAAAALDNQPELAKLKTRLKLVTVPGGGSLYNWIRDFLLAGDSIDKYLRQRAKVLAASDGANASSAGPLRGSTIGLLGRFREALRDEMEEPGSTLPPDYDQNLFSYIDKLNADRELANRTRSGASGDGTSEAPGSTETTDANADTRTDTDK